MPTLSAIVPASNDPPTLAGCLDAIRSADDPPEQIVVASEGDGPAAARNAGAAEASGEVLVFVDADVLPHADAFSRIRLAFDDDPELTAIFGSYDDEPGAPGAVSAFRNLLHHHVHQEGAGPASTFWAGLGAIRRPAFERAGGFDAARYRVPSVEDIDLGARLAARGEQILLDPLVQGTHLKQWTLASMVRTDFSRRGVPWIELILRDGATPSALNLGWRHRASAAAAVLAGMGLVRARPGQIMFALGALVALNGAFYRLLAEKRGNAEAALGVGLHAVHHATGVAAAAVGVARYLRDG
jgi:hypothetical protein